MAGYVFDASFSVSIVIVMCVRQDVWTWGDNFCGQLGSPEAKKQQKPTLVQVSDRINCFKALKLLSLAVAFRIRKL